jgi:thiol-disulfide isomerase/thioredoxin
MSFRKRFGTAALLLLALVAGMVARTYLLPGPTLQAVSDRAAVEDFALPDLDGQVRRLSEFAGKTVVLNFWASWCGPCLEEIPDFVDLQARYADRGVQFLGVAVEDAASAQSMAARLNNSVGALPYTVIIGPDGRERARLTGRADPADVQKWLDAARS